MSEPTMLERIARRIKRCDDVFPLGDSREYLSDKEALALARAAVEAMREPSEWVLNAVCEADASYRHSEWPREKNTKHMLRVLCDSILSEGEVRDGKAKA